MISTRLLKSLVITARCHVSCHVIHLYVKIESVQQYLKNLYSTEMSMLIYVNVICIVFRERKLDLAMVVWKQKSLLVPVD